MKAENRLPDNEVDLKISVCQKCNGNVTVAVDHLMTKESLKAFYKEVVKFDLLIKSQDLISYRTENADFCSCKS